MSEERERKPYNPYHLAGGYAAASLPDKKTIAVFKCYCNHTDFMGGSVSISLPTVMRETGYSYRAVCYADAVLTSMGRITKKSRGIGGQRGGRQSSITTVYCTAEELQRAGANDENFFGRGGKAGLFKVQAQPIQNAKRVHSKCKQDGFKVQRVALEPLKSEPFPTPEERQAIRQYAIAKTRIGAEMRCAIDAVQNSIAFRWKKTLQIASLFVSGVVGVIALQVGASPSLPPTLGASVVIGLLAGFLAPVARDLVAAIESWRNN